MTQIIWKYNTNTTSDVLASVTHSLRSNRPSSRGPFSKRMKRAMEDLLQSPVAAAVIAIRPLCIKHTFVERREGEEGTEGNKSESWVNSSQRSI